MRHKGSKLCRPDGKGLPPIKVPHGCTISQIIPLYVKAEKTRCIMASKNFKKLLKKYLSIKGLDIVVYLEDGAIIELNKNRVLVKNEIIIRDKNNRELRIDIASIKSVEMYAA